MFRWSRRFAHHSAASSGQRRLTLPPGAPSFGWGDLVEYCDFRGSFNLALVTSVSQSSPHRSLLNLFLPNRGALQTDSFFIRFWTPQLLKQPADDTPLEPSLAASCIDAFETQSRNLLHAHFVSFEQYVRQQRQRLERTDGLGTPMLFYEADLAEAVFGPQPRPEELYAVHLYMFSFSTRFGRDPAYTIAIPPHGASRDSQRMISASGPYFWRDTHLDYSALQHTIELIKESSELVARFRKDLTEALRAKRTERFGGRAEYRPFFNLLQRASVINWQDSHHNPMLEAVQLLLRGVAPWSRPGDLNALLSHLGLQEEMQDQDIPLLQSGLEPRRAITQDAQLRVVQAEPASVRDHEGGPGRRRIFNQVALAIDAEGTVEVDDAISIERCGEETWLHVHVADPAALVQPHSSEDQHAMERVTTLYLAHDTFPMLPHKLGAHASLTPERSHNLTLTFSARISASGDLLDYSVALGTLTQLRRITYKECEHLLERDQGEEEEDGSAKIETSQMLRELDALATRHESFRHGKGSLALEFPSMRPHLSRHPNGALASLTLTDDRRGAPRMRNVVAECMIIAGRVAAAYALERRLAVPFRYHPDPAIQGGDAFRELYDRVQQAGSLATLYDRLRLVSYFQASAVDTVPRAHWSMGLEAYCKATSPLRRYFDLLLHQQIRASLTGGETRNVEAVRSILPPVYRHEQYVKRLMNQSNRYWTYRYIELTLRDQQPERSDNWAPLRVNAIPLEYYPSSGKVQLFVEDFALRTFDTVPGGMRLELGQTYQLDIVAVDAPRQTLTLRLPL